MFNNNYSQFPQLNKMSQTRQNEELKDGQPVLQIAHTSMS